MRAITETIVKGLNEAVTMLRENRNGGQNVQHLCFADRVRNLRNRLGLTQQEFAEMYDLTLGTVRNWEQKRGSRDGPDRTAKMLLLLIEQDPKGAAAIVANRKERIAEDA